MSEELKKCPFCGNEVKIHGPEDWKPSFYDPDSGGDPYEAYCDCGLSFSIGYVGFDEFAQAWDRRVQDDE